MIQSYCGDARYARLPSGMDARRRLLVIASLVLMSSVLTACDKVSLALVILSPHSDSAAAFGTPSKTKFARAEFSACLFPTVL